MAESLNYLEKANIKLEFKSLNNFIYYNLCGFLGEEGLTLGLNNRFQNSLELAGSIFSQFQELIVGTKAAGAGIGDWLTKAGVTEESAIGKLAKNLSNQTQSYVSLGGKGGNIILNAPYYWQGGDPIEFNISLYQIADNETDILQSYQRVLEILSPNFNNASTQNTQGGQNKQVVGYGEGPGYALVHYFPVNGSWGASAEGTGTIILGPCLCKNVTMEIKAPYSAKYMPIIGSYRFSMMAARILDRSAINQIFQGTNGSLFSCPSQRNIPTNITNFNSNPIEETLPEETIPK